MQANGNLHILYKFSERKDQKEKPRRIKLNEIYERITRLLLGKQWIQRHPVISFPVVYLGWAYLFWTPVLLTDTSIWEFPSLLWFLIGGASPLIAGVFLASLEGGHVQLRDLLYRLIDWRRISWKWWFTILSFWLFFDFVMAVAAFLLEITDSPLDIHWRLWLNPKALLFLILLSFVFPAIEEIGLRGYYLDTLQKSLNPVAAGTLNGVVCGPFGTPHSSGFRDIMPTQLFTRRYHGGCR